MPGCGKSAIGRNLARVLGKQFLDLDRLIEEEARKPIPRMERPPGKRGTRRTWDTSLPAWY